MSWFKRGDRKSPAMAAEVEKSNTYREVFQNHWKQVCLVINGQDKSMNGADGVSTVDGVETVLHNLEQMITLLVGEDDEAGLPGPILQYVLEEELLERVCTWCSINVQVHDRLRLQQLRLFEHLISQSKQLLLVHKPVIKPLLRLLKDVADGQEMVNNVELEFKLVLVLHQICICISQQSLILESFFSTDADHGPARFLIFSLLIPYIHCEGPVGQKARDALLLIMTLSARHPHIGHYIANHSHFCPVLATGLSGLYSSLPRRLCPPSPDWYCITPEDCLHIPDLNMFLNSLEFSNAVVQVAHPLVRDQLIEFIYSGFLVPVLAPALHQGRPNKGRKVSREEVLTATAYLDLFVRHISEPNLLRAVLRFVMTCSYDGTQLLDSLLSRINSNTLLSTVTLALFNTLIDLNCEDVMFQLVFRYLVPCTHVMVSQRLSVRDLDLYGKSAEKFLSLRPICCKNGENETSHVNSTSSSGLPVLSTNTSNWDINESSYADYLLDAQHALAQKRHATVKWKYRYDGESPLPDSVLETDNLFLQKKDMQIEEGPISPPTGFIEVGTISQNSGAGDGTGNNDSSAPALVTQNVSVADSGSASQTDKNVSEGKWNNNLSKLYASLDSVEDFLRNLDSSDCEDLLKDSGLSCGENGKSASEVADLLEVVLEQFELASANRKGGNVGCVSKRARIGSKTGKRSGKGDDDCHDKSNDSAVDIAFLSPVLKASDVTASINAEKHGKLVRDLHGLSVSSNTAGEVDGGDKTSLCGVEGDSSDIVATDGANVKIHNVHNMQQNMSSFVNISIVPSASKDKDESINESLSSIAAVMNEEASSSSLSYPSAVTPPTPSTSTHNNRLDNRKPRNIPTNFPTNLQSVLVSTPRLTPSLEVAKTPCMVPVTPADEFPQSALHAASSKKQLKYLTDPPNIGPFLSSLLSRLEGMAGNSLYFNLLLTGVIAQLAAYPQPLLRSFLLNHNLVFQPSVKSLVQVLSSLRQKLDTYAVSVQNFNGLVASARQNLTQREILASGSHPSTLIPGQDTSLVGHDTSQIFGGSFSGVDNGFNQKQSIKSLLPGQMNKEKRKVTLSDIFRRSPAKDKTNSGKKRSMSLLDRIQSPGSEVYRQFNNNEDRLSNSAVNSSSSNVAGADKIQSLSTWNAVYCAVILDEFVKELSALSLEHSLVLADDLYHNC